MLFCCFEFHLLSHHPDAALARRRALPWAEVAENMDAFSGCSPLDGPLQLAVGHTEGANNDMIARIHLSCVLFLYKSNTAIEIMLSIPS